MINDISFLTGIKDPGLKFDQDGIEDTGNLKILHLIKTGKYQCLVCGRPMLKNGFRKRPVKIQGLPIANVPTVLLIKKQKYICPSSAICPQTVTKIAPIIGIKAGCRIANNVKQAVTLNLSKNISQKDLGEQYWVSASTVGRIIEACEDDFRPVNC